MFSILFTLSWVNSIVNKRLTIRRRNSVYVNSLKIFNNNNLKLQLAFFWCRETQNIYFVNSFEIYCRCSTLEAWCWCQSRNVQENVIRLAKKTFKVFFSFLYYHFVSPNSNVLTFNSKVSKATFDNIIFVQLNLFCQFCFMNVHKCCKICCIAISYDGFGSLKFWLR